MLLERTTLLEEDIPKLMAIYAEGNAENGAYFYPECSKVQGILRAEQDFIRFLREDFFSAPGNVLYVWQTGGQWVSALRLTKRESFWFLEALETKPELRRQGFGKTLLQAVCHRLEQQGPVVIRDHVRKTNEASLETHRAAGFVVEQDPVILGGKPDARYYGLVYRSGPAL